MFLTVFNAINVFNVIFQCLTVFDQLCLQLIGSYSRISGLLSTASAELDMDKKKPEIVLDSVITFFQDQQNLFFQGAARMRRKRSERFEDQNYGDFPEKGAKRQNTRSISVKTSGHSTNFRIRYATREAINKKAIICSLLDFAGKMMNKKRLNQEKTLLNPCFYSYFKKHIQIFR